MPRLLRAFVYFFLAVCFSSLVPAAFASRVEDRVIVGYVDGSTPAQRAALHQRADAVPAPKTFAEDTQVLVAGDSRSEVLADLRKSSLVEWAVPDRVVEAQLTPSDSGFASQWGLHNTGQLAGSVVDADIDAPEAWDLQGGDPSLKVGVVDTGLDRTQTDVEPWVNSAETPSNGLDDDDNGYVDDYYGWDFINNDADPAEDHYHGTAVASTAVAKRSSGGPVVGSGQGRVVTAKSLGSNGLGSLSSVANGLRYAAAQGARVVNMSIGWSDATNLSQTPFSAVYADYPETLFVVAAGNDAVDSDASAAGASCRNPAPNLICVAATASDDTRSSFSNWGATSVDIGAPGSMILALRYPGLNNTAYFNGTSLAAPMVAGIGTLILAERPNATARQIKDAIITGADVTTSLAGITTSGRRANARGALQAISSVAAASPASSAAPQVSGTLTVGGTLTASTGTWSGSPTTYAYRWQTCQADLSFCTNLASATGASFTPTSALQGRRLRVQVYAQGADGRSGLAYSALTTPVGGEVAPQVSRQPSLSVTTPRVRQALTVDAGATSNSATSAVTWESCLDASTCTTVGSADSFTVRDADHGRRLRARVTWTNSAGTTVTTTTSTDVVRGLGPVRVSGSLALLGDPKVGETLAVSFPLIDAGVPAASAPSYRWQACRSGACADVGSSSTYTPTSIDSGATVRVIVTWTNAEGSLALEQDAGHPVWDDAPPQISGQAVIEGSAVVGQTLRLGSLTIHSASAYVTRITWEACSTLACVPLDGEGWSMTVPQGTTGQTLRATLTASSSSGATSVVASSVLVTEPPSEAIPRPPHATPLPTRAWPRPMSPIQAPSDQSDTDESLGDAERVRSLTPTIARLRTANAALTVRCADASGCKGSISVYARVGRRLIRVAVAKVRVAQGTKTVRIKMTTAQRRTARRATSAQAVIQIGDERRKVALKLR